MTRFPNMLVIATAVILLAGCDTTSPSDHREELVVESYLVSGESLPPVWLARSQDIDATWDGSTVAVSQAAVRIEVLSSDGSVELSIPFERTFESAGKYVPTIDHTVVPGTTYRLVAEAAGMPPIQSETTVPEQFELLEVSHSAIQYLDPEQFSFLVTQSRFVDRQSIFVFTIASRNPDPNNLVQPYLEFFFEKEERESGQPLEFAPGEREELSRFTSPPINEGNYDIFADGTLRVRLPWFAVAFYGETDITMSVLDDNLYDFQRYQQTQQDGGLLSPGEIPNVLDPVDGGAGIFGSMARVSATVDILPEAGR
ncbi:MAG: DUF4249 family protein [Bacteroidota bacterium]|nr:DUF4249 family protein [Bacteroidota bacterium]